MEECWEPLKLYTKSIAYKSLIRPKLKYCSHIWDPQHKLDILKNYNKAARFTVKDFSGDSSITTISLILNGNVCKSIEQDYT